MEIEGDRGLKMRPEETAWPCASNPFLSHWSAGVHQTKATSSQRLLPENSIDFDVVQGGKI